MAESFQVGQTGTPLARTSKVASTTLSEKERDALNQMLMDKGTTRYKYLRYLILRELVQEGYLNRSDVRGRSRMDL